MFWALQRRTSAPVRAWRVVVTFVTIASFGTILGIEGAPASMLLALVVMHVVAGAAAYAVTPTVAARRAL